MAFVQTASANISGSTISLPLTGVAAGSALIVAVAQTGAGTRSYTAADDVAGSLTSLVSYFPTLARGVQIFVVYNVAAGSHTVTVTQSSTSVTAQATIIEWSGLGTGATAIVGTFDDGAAANTHYCAEVGSIDTTGPCAIICAWGLNSFSGISAYAAGTSGVAYTRATGTPGPLVQYYDAASAVTDERGEWSHTGTNQRGFSAMVALPYPSAVTASVTGGWFGH